MIDVTPVGIRASLEKALPVRILLVEYKENRLEVVFDPCSGCCTPDGREWSEAFSLFLPAYAIPHVVNVRDLIANKTSTLKEENLSMKKTIKALTYTVAGLLFLVIALLFYKTDPPVAAAVVSVDVDKATEPVAKPGTEPEPLPPSVPVSEAPPAKWKHLGTDAWEGLLPGKWQGASDSHVSAVFEFGRPNSRTPWNVTLGEPDGKGGMNWYGCGFYGSGISYCRGPDDEKSTQGVVTIKGNADTNTIQFVAFQGEFDFEIERVAVE